MEIQHTVIPIDVGEKITLSPLPSLTTVHTMRTHAIREMIQGPPAVRRKIEPRPWDRCRFAIVFDPQCNDIIPRQRATANWAMEAATLDAGAESLLHLGQGIGA